MKKSEFKVRPIAPTEIAQVADLLSTGYYDDDFFIWSVDNDDERHSIVVDYYKIYLNVAGCIAHVAETEEDGIIGAAVWLPHDVDAGIYDEIDKAAGRYAPQFRAVCDKSHESEPPIEPFYQLVGFGVLKKMQSRGVGSALLKYQLDNLDKMGIATYLEASTPYYGGGVYGRFGYQQVGELIVFAEKAVLYPLWRPAAKVYKTVNFGDYSWLVLETCGGKTLLLSEDVISLQKYHDAFEDVDWAASSVRGYLNSVFYNSFKPEERTKIIETQVNNNGNPWYEIEGGVDTIDKIFLLSIEEVIKYFGDSGQLKNPISKHFIDDHFNKTRQAVYKNSDLEAANCRWMLRTPGNLPYFVATVTVEGKIAVSGDFVNRDSTSLFNVGVRAAMWVSEDAVELN